MTDDADHPASILSQRLHRVRDLRQRVGIQCAKPLVNEQAIHLQGARRSENLITELQSETKGGHEGLTTAEGLRPPTLAGVVVVDDVELSRLPLQGVSIRDLLEPHRCPSNQGLERFLQQEFLKAVALQV